MIQIDMNMPNNCQECRFLFDTLEGGTTYYYCFAAETSMNEEDVGVTCRPDWCSLKEAPINYMNGFTRPTRNIWEKSK